MLKCFIYIFKKIFFLKIIILIEIILSNFLKVIFVINNPWCLLNCFRLSIYPFFKSKTIKESVIVYFMWISICSKARCTSICPETRCLMSEGVPSSSNSNHRHPNLFCGKRTPQLVISTTSISNHRKILFSVIWI